MEDKRYSIKEIITDSRKNCFDPVVIYHLHDQTEDLIYKKVKYFFGLLSKKGNVINGTVFYEEISFSFEVSVKDGKKHGVQKVWWGRIYENELKSKGEYKNGKKQGLHEEWYTNGNLKTQENYKDGEIVSEKNWDQNKK
ncbi:MAG: hypothetical protein H8E16_10120 [Flavobacteriales bacterium]|nr:hypothetical protein [Flavobacteriales bacterium]